MRLSEHSEAEVPSRWRRPFAWASEGDFLEAQPLQILDKYDSKMEELRKTGTTEPGTPIVLDSLVQDIADPHDHPTLPSFRSTASILTPSMKRPSVRVWLMFIFLMMTLWLEFSASKLRGSCC